MGKIPTFPTLYNEALQLSITKLKEWGYLKKDQIKSGTINWSRNGNPTGSISINSNTFSNPPFIELDYNFRNEPRNYKVYLISANSNLNKGLIWYFLCPQTQKRCRKLYSIGGYFLHREAFKGCFYSKQIESKRYRFLENTFGHSFRAESYYSQLRRKHAKTHYKGKPTKWLLKIQALIQKSEAVSMEEMENFIYGSKRRKRSPY